MSDMGDFWTMRQDFKSVNTLLNDIYEHGSVYIYCKVRCVGNVGAQGRFDAKQMFHLIDPEHKCAIIVMYDEDKFNVKYGDKVWLTGIVGFRVGYGYFIQAELIKTNRW